MKTNNSIIKDDNKSSIGHGVKAVLATFAYTIWLMVLPFLLVFLVGCGETFPSFNEVDRFRVLSVKADPPALALGEVAEVSALLHVPEGQEVSYKWSWCPFATSPGDGSKCLISEEALTELVRGLAENPQDFIGDAGDLLGNAGDLIGAPEDLVDDAEAFVGDELTNRMRSRALREPWRV